MASVPLFVTSSRRARRLHAVAVTACAVVCTAQVAAQTPAAAPTAAPGVMTYVFVCPGGAEQVVRTTESEAWVFRATGTLRLPAVAGPEATVYADSKLELRITGEEAQFRAAGREPQTCGNDRRRAIWEKAKLDGVDFRSTGNEPPWVLEIQQQSRAVLLTDYGGQRVEVPLPPPQEDRGTRTTRWDAGDLQIEAIAHSCRDTMSGEAFETEVVVRWQGRTLRGCGRPLH